METKPTAPPDQQCSPQQVWYPQQEGYPPQDQPPMYSPQQAGYPPAYPAGQYQPAITQQPAPVQQTTHTTVVMNQQPVLVQRTTRDWSTGLCGCFEDCGSCKYLPRETQHRKCWIAQIWSPLHPKSAVSIWHLLKFGKFFKKECVL